MVQNGITLIFLMYTLIYLISFIYFWGAYRKLIKERFGIATSDPTNLNNIYHNISLYPTMILFYVRFGHFGLFVYYRTEVD